MSNHSRHSLLGQKRCWEGCAESEAGIGKPMEMVLALDLEVLERAMSYPLVVVGIVTYGGDPLMTEK